VRTRVAIDMIALLALETIWAEVAQVANEAQAVDVAT
jgi:hypothetical protein